MNTATMIEFSRTTSCRETFLVVEESCNDNNCITMNESDLQQRMHLLEKHLDSKYDMNLSDKMFVNKIKK